MYHERTNTPQMAQASIFTLATPIIDSNTAIETVIQF